MIAGLISILLALSTPNMQNGLQNKVYASLRGYAIEAPICLTEQELINYEKLAGYEFVVPSIVMECYQHCVDSSAAVPLATYINENFLKGKEKKFRKKLEQFCTDEEIEHYIKLFSTKGLIIYKKSLLKRQDFEKIIKHERMHREVDRLSQKDKQKIIKAWMGLKDRKKKDGTDLLEDKPEYRPFAKFAVWINWEEFFPHLISGSFYDDVLDTLKQDYPEAYQLYEKLKNKIEKSLPELVANISQY